MDTKDYLNGKANDAYGYFGPVKKTKGYMFRICHPHAKKVEIIGDFNDWQPKKMRGYASGVFTITIKEAKIGDRYQFLITDANDEVRKIVDPFAQEIIVEEKCSVVSDNSYKFKNKKLKTDKLNIYEVYMGSFLDSDFDGLIKYAKDQNFTHIKFMPVSEYINYKSMGFTSSGLFAYSKRYGSSIDFKKFIDKCHKEKLGVLIDLDLAHFDCDPYYLKSLEEYFAYDYDDIKYSYYGDINFDPTKNFTKSYLKSAVNFWLKEYNLDGIMLTNVENMIYWQGDEARGENDKWIDLLEDLIEEIHKNKALALASFNGIYKYDFDFDYCLDYSLRPIIRSMQDLPFKRDSYKKEINSLIGSDNSKKILGFNYIDSFLDEASLFMKINGSNDKYKQYKTMLTLLYSLNSKKLLFNGDEIGSEQIFSIYDKVDLENLGEGQVFVNYYYKDISKLYLEKEELNHVDSTTKLLDIEGYSLYAYIRAYKEKKLLVIINFTDIDYEIKSPYDLVELINSSDLKYGGKGNINGKINQNETIFIEDFGACVFEIKKWWVSKLIIFL